MAIEKIKTDIGEFWGYSQDHLFKCLKSGEGFDKSVKEYILKNIGKDDVVCDFGSNIGFFTILLSKLAKKVYAFEPQKVVFDLLNSNIELNNCSNVLSYNLALNNKECLMDFSPKQDDWVGKLSDNYNEINSIGSISFSENSNGRILAKRADSIINEKIDFIKIDTESADISVILGCEKLIEKYRPVIIFEYNEQASRNNYGKDINDLNEIIEKYNYNLEKLDEGNWILK